VAQLVVIVKIIVMRVGGGLAIEQSYLGVDVIGTEDGDVKETVYESHRTR